MAIKWANNATTTIASGISSSATTITVAGSAGSLFPSAGGADYFYATLNDSSNNIEIVKVTARSGDVMTVVRGQDGTTARAWIGGDKFELRPTAAGLAAAASGENIVNLAVAKGGTGANNASDARVNLGTVNDPGSNGIMVRTSANTTTVRSITVGSGLTISNGDAIAADPNITNDGVLALTAGTGISISGTNANKTIANAGVTSFNGATGDVLSPAPTVQTFTSSGVWTKPANLRAARIRVVGGGGNGGALGSGGSGKTAYTYGGGGGGGGGYSEKIVLAASLGATETVTVGTAGLTSSFGAHCSATGGSVGGTGNAQGGAGGIGSGGTTNAAGNAGVQTQINQSGSSGGQGGGSVLGGGGQRATAGRAYGGGGGGNAGAGAAGIVIVEEFY